MKLFNDYIEMKQHIADTFYTMAKSKRPKALQEFFVTSEGRKYSYNARKDVVLAHPKDSVMVELLAAFDQFFDRIK
jgi:hypothetical protein